VSDSFLVSCPYCGEEIELYLEPDVRGDLVQDCEVCCNPWLIRVFTDEGDRNVQVTRADGTD
jgi:cysteine-rich CPXCG protein